MKASIVKQLAVGLAVAASAPVGASVAYSTDFQAVVGAEWSDSRVASAPNPDYAGTRRFLGQFGNETVNLNLSGLASHTTVMLAFDLYVIRSWDGISTAIVNGDNLGPDVFRVNGAGVGSVFNATFSNGWAPGNPGHYQSYGNAGQDSCNSAFTDHLPPGLHGAMTGAAECYSLGYADWTIGPSGDGDKTKPWQDAVYRITVDFAHAGSALDLGFTGFGLQGITDESWGIDNVRVATDAVVIPIPSVAGLLISGLLVAGVCGRRFTALPRAPVSPTPRVRSRHLPESGAALPS